VTTDEESLATFYPIPTGWTWAHLHDLVLQPRSDIVDGPFGSDLKASEYKNEGIPIVRLQNIDRNEFIKKNIKFITKQKANALNRHNFVKGDIIITKLGAPLGKACLVPNNIEYGILVADVVRLRVSEKNISKKYVLHAINSNIGAKQFEEKTKGTTRPRVNLNHIRELVIPIPPLNEQFRIVGKVEELFSFLDAGVASLHAVQAQLKRYRQAVLKAAFEGKLTEQWQLSHKDQIEPAQELLQRIRVERQKSKREIYRKSTQTIPSLFALPAKWIWVILDEISIIDSGQTPKGLERCKKSGEMPFFKVGDMNKPENQMFMKKADIYLTTEEVNKLKITLHPTGTVIFPKRGGAIATNKKRILSQASGYDLNIMGIYPLIISPNFIYHWLSSIDLSKLSDGSNIPQINHKDVCPLPFALPPLEEQKIIEEEIENRLLISEQVEKTIATSLKQAEFTRQSILIRAFEGKLASQDSADEPAEKLLERIKAERLNYKSKSNQLELSQYVK
jgi:type I restriction enzyme S subunit